MIPNIPQNPTELLKSDKVKELIKDLKVFYDIVIFDTVPVLEASEAVKMSEVSDLTLILSSYGNTRKEELTITYKESSNGEGSVIGIGINKIPEEKFKKNIIALKNNTQKRINKFFKKVIGILSKVKKVSVIFEKIFAILTAFFGIIVARNFEH